MSRPSITFWRRLVQVLCFAFFVYGGWLAAVALSGGATRVKIGRAHV